MSDQDNNKNNFHERRSEPRIKVSGNVTLMLDNSKEKISGSLIDISGKGLAFHSKKAFKENTCHFLSISLPNGTVLEHIKGKVVRQVKIGSNYITAMVFISISQMTTQSIKEYLDNMVI
ncbi:MAG: PilZ domain-containing protein [Elusimicrobiota bacterium]